MHIKSLCGKWRLEDFEEKYALDASVPGCNYLDLLNADIIDDPFYGTNEKKCYWVAQTDWIYSKSFTLTKDELSYRHISLECLRLDTVCDIYVNGTKAGHAENCHIAHSFDVRELLTEGENTVSIYFHSPVNYVKSKYKTERTPANSNGQNGISHIRKPQCHFGWDWGPVLPPSGIGDEIFLEMRNGGKIHGAKIMQNRNSDGSFTVYVQAEAETVQNEKIDIMLYSPDGSLLNKGNGFSAEFCVNKPKLWWTHDLSDKKEQPLYTVEITLYDGNAVLQTLKKKIGFRTVELNRKNDEYGQNFQFILNGVPMFIKGANYIPADSFITRLTQEKLEYIIDSAVFSNMNLIRVWGGGYYESDDFYDLCDKKGILVWQDFCFACQPYPFFDESFLENVKSEVEYNVKRLRHHASLALWCGNNEIESMSIAWKNRVKYVRWTEKFFYDILPDEVRKYDSETAFIPGTPCGVGHMKGFDRDNVGDTHLWAVWHGLQPMKYYRKRMTRFCSEFGFESLPDIKAVRQFAKPDDYDLHSPVFKAHQKCASGNDKMIYYIASRFRLPKNFEDWIYLSQVTQLECISDATEHWRRNKGRCNGSVYWQLNDCWGVCSWSSLDYYGNYKALQYKARHFNAPLSVSIEDTDDSVNIYVLNDKNEDADILVRCEIFDFEKGVTESIVNASTVKKLQNEKVISLSMQGICEKYDLSKTGVRAILFSGSEQVNEKVLLFKPEKELSLPDAGLWLKAKENGGEISVTVSSENFARLVRIQSDISSLPFSDNYFDLLPGESKTVTLPTEKDIDIKKQLDALSVFCANKIEPKGTPVYDIKERIRVFLQPVNFVQWVYSRNIPKDLKIK